MYITYERTQFSDYKKKRLALVLGALRPYPDGLRRYAQPPRRMPPVILKPECMPRYLVRVSDMKVVRGSQVNEGYCALSYAWSQTGDVIQDQIVGRVNKRHPVDDQGKHKIIYPTRVARKKTRGRKRYPRKTKFVKFEGLIQQICKDFNIKYIWYDRLSLPENNEREDHKSSEDKKNKDRSDILHQMKTAYSNAYCTVALIPEFQSKFVKLRGEDHHRYMFNKSAITMESEWAKQLWSLGETIMSSKILFIGRNVHTWWYNCCEHEPLFARPTTELKAKNILYYAHTRTCIDPYDRVFALANILPQDAMNKVIVMNKNQSALDLLIQFYGQLAKMDISILFFCGYSQYIHRYHSLASYRFANFDENKANKEIPIRQYFNQLPSWTGVGGEHLNFDINSPFQDYTIDGSIMKVTCGTITNNQFSNKNPFTLEYDDLPPVPREQCGKSSRRCRKSDVTYWNIALVVRLPGHTSDKTILFLEESVPVPEDGKIYKSIVKAIRWNLQMLSHFIYFTKENLVWCEPSYEILRHYAMFRMDDELTEYISDADQYVILSEIQFKVEGDRKKGSYHPVIKKNGDYYKMLGVCYIFNSEYLLSGFSPPKQTYLIQ